MSHALNPQPGSLSLPPAVLAGLALAAGLYAVGWHRLGRRGRGRARPAAWRAGCYAAGLAALAAATLPPIASDGERLFFVHMIQHLLLAMLAPPLLWLGAPLVPSLWGAPRGLRRRVGRLLVARHPVRRTFRLLTQPGVASVLYLSTLAGWHLPALYDAAQGPTLTHDLEHAAFLGTALLYWWPVIYPIGGRRPLPYGATLLYLVPPMLVGDLIGAVLTFAQWPLYAAYAFVGRADASSAVADQQLGGLIMWIGGGLLWLVAMGVTFFLASGDQGLETGRLPADTPHDPIV